jgi:pilus assembly protein Flp/PilA
MSKRLDGANNRERGATAVEYAIMVAFIAAAIFGSVTLFGAAVTGLFTTVIDNWP